MIGDIANGAGSRSLVLGDSGIGARPNVRSRYGRVALRNLVAYGNTNMYRPVSMRRASGSNGE